MSSPRVIVQIFIAGAQIFGKALLAAGRQAAQNAKHRPPTSLGGDAAGVGNATSGSLTDRLTREHRMTLDEARLILNIKKDDPVDRILQHYDNIFKANSPPEPVAKPAAGTKAIPPRFHSHYLQSKVLRAKERMEAELKAGEEPAPPPPPPPPSSSAPSESGSKPS